MVNASALGFDLVRLPGGAAVAATLIDALVTDAADLATLPTAARTGSSARAVTPTVARVLVAHRDDRSRQARSLAADLATLGAELAVAPLGTLADVQAFVSGEVFDWCWTGAPDLTTRIPAAAAAVSHVCAQLERDWGSVAAALPASRPRGDLGPQTRRLGQLLDAASTFTTHDIDHLDEMAVRRRPGAWSQAMHEATLALDLSGRLRTSTLTQLHLVLSLRAAALPPIVVAGSAWNALSGVAVAVLVEDLLADSDLQVLRDPWATLLGR